MAADPQRMIADLQRRIAVLEAAARIAPTRAAVGGAAAAVPKPTEKYQVYQPVDDMLKPIWTRLRVQG